MEPRFEERWHNIDRGPMAQWKPAMMIVNTEGGVTIMCGGHKKGRAPNDIIL